jgi:hypothetical protein
VFKKSLVLFSIFQLLSSVAFAEEPITPISDMVKNESIQEKTVTAQEESEITPDNYQTQKHKVTGKTILAGTASFLVWPGIGQAINDNKGSKVLTHVILGAFVPPFRFWSGYDAIVGRQEGYWNGKI